MFLEKTIKISIYSGVDKINCLLGKQALESFFRDLRVIIIA